MRAKSNKTVLSWKTGIGGESESNYMYWKGWKYVSFEREEEEERN
jgi:hypothetical protein